jgi:hypothetical protein
MSSIPVSKEQTLKYKSEYKRYVGDEVLNALDKAVRVVKFETFLMWKVLRERYY